MNPNERTGLVTRLQAGFYTVRADLAEYTCRIRGKLKKEMQNSTLVAVGDQVRFSVLPDRSGVIEEIFPRKKEFYRLSPGTLREFKQVLLANPEQVLLVFACAEPEPSLRMLDRFLVITEKQQIPEIIIANKVDLVGEKKAAEIFSLYTELNYRVLYTSAKQGFNIQSFHEVLKGKISALAGPSGAGKSSLLNCIQPGLGLRIGQVKGATGKGKHTTVVRELIALEEDGFVADMPGPRTLSLWDTQPEELDGYFPELRGLVSGCLFSNCSHDSEPGCAVKLAVEEGRVHPARYESYIRMRIGDEG